MPLTKDHLAAFGFPKKAALTIRTAGMTTAEMCDENDKLIKMTNHMGGNIRETRGVCLVML